MSLTFSYVLCIAFGHCCSFQGSGTKEPETRIQFVALSTCIKNRAADRSGTLSELQLLGSLS